MRKTAIILAGAVAFDLGVMVVPAHAAADMFLKVENTKEQEATTSRFLKIDNTLSVEACRNKGGTVVQQQGQQQCQLPEAKGKVQR